MKRFISFFGALTILLGVSGSASAGYWEVEYDLAGSTVDTIVTLASLTNTDNLIGNFTLRYDAVSPTAPITGAEVVAGTQTLNIAQTNGGLFGLTGPTKTVLTPPPGDGVINASTVNMSGAAIPNQVTGFLHCYDGAFQCTAAGYPATASSPSGASVPKGQTPTVSSPINLGKFVFSGGVGTSDFLGSQATRIIPATTGGSPQVTLVTHYVGTEISRSYTATGVPAGSNATRIGLGLFVLLSGVSGLALLRSRRARQAG